VLLGTVEPVDIAWLLSLKSGEHLVAGQLESHGWLSDV
jgi:hypothetical protein